MILLTKELIEKLNSQTSSSEQGIYVQPYGIPVSIKEAVIYMRHETGGVTGGSCWQNSHNRRYFNEEPDFEILDMVLNELHPNITYLQYKKIANIIHTNEETQYEYYGNSIDYTIKYIVVSDLIKLLESF